MTKFQKLVLKALWCLVSDIDHKTDREWRVIKELAKEIGEDL